jgi:ubiquinone/menaquinone biosynthesis C-methylase UbiE
MTNDLKPKVKTFWNKEACGTWAASSEKYSRNYFDEIEEYRYQVEPEIFSFAQFTRFYGKKILEVGVGAGTDFLQFVRAGAEAYGIDLTEEAVEHVKKRLDVYGLAAKEVKVADAENLPYKDNTFDLVYSYGVIHHSPNFNKALEEIIRVASIGGRIKIMVYHRRSLNAFSKYLMYGLRRGKPFQSFSKILFNHMESIGTKAFTVKEIKGILSRYPISIKKITTNASYYDLNWGGRPFRIIPFRYVPYILSCLLGYDRIGWFMNIDLVKTDKC